MAGLDEPWKKIDHALREGPRGLPGGTTLARLLLEHRGARAPHRPPDLSIDQILAWADDHRAATGQWPTVDSGTVTEAPTETWMKIQGALLEGGRGLAEKTSLARLLVEHRAARKKKHLARLTLEQIRGWAADHHAAHGQWPTKRSGPVRAAAGETWKSIDRALHNGYRGLPTGLTLAQVLSTAARSKSRR